MAGSTIVINTRSSGLVSAGTLPNLLGGGSFEIFGADDVITGYVGNVATGLFNGDTTINDTENELEDFTTDTEATQSYVTMYNEDYLPVSQSFFDVIYFNNSGSNSYAPKRAYLQLKNYLDSFPSAVQNGVALAFHRELFRDRLDPISFQLTASGNNNFRPDIDSSSIYALDSYLYLKHGGTTDTNTRFYPSKGIVLITGSKFGDPTTATEAANNLVQIIAKKQEVTKSYIYFVRAKNSKFNHSNNPSFVSASGGQNMIRPSIRYADNNSPITYITTVGLYNDASELLAVGKVSNPIYKSYASEALIKVKVDF
jgi:hypothetical protein